MKQKSTVVSLFAGCGGSSLGYEQAGFQELLAVDFNDHAVETFRLNFPDVPMWKGDITTITPEKILQAIGLKKGELDVLDGSPPCQGFSSAGKRKMDDTRSDLVYDYLRILRGLMPRCFVMENVRGMAYGKMAGIFNNILKEMRKSGYVVKCKLMNAKNHGVAQSRTRAIFIGVRKDLKMEPVYPIPEARLISMREALQGVPVESPPEVRSDEYKKVIPKMRQGMNMQDAGGKGFQQQRGVWMEPAPCLLKGVSTTPGYGDLFHPLEDRVLTTAEMKRICSFPDSFKFPKGKNAKMEWVNARERLGNAVMPEFMRRIAKALKQGVLDKLPASARPKLPVASRTSQKPTGKKKAARSPD